MKPSELYEVLLALITERYARVTVREGHDDSALQ